ncbi:MAG TPA: polyhydroxyalkanoic acid system family protein [Usitatibacteraceae bacterium]|nr:polyhydroxyalkanoic acid system family protein [Usitatibacteraceae bacterium]
MADISIKRAHHLGLQGAREAADTMAGRLAEKFDLSGDWQGDVLHFRRSGVQGSLAVSDHDMKLEVTLGFMLKMMKGPIEAAVHEQLEKVLAAPARSSRPKTSEAKAAAAKKPAPRKK